MALTPADFQQIQTLYARYTMATDAGPAEAWVGCFTPDGSVEVRGTTHKGREALQKFAEGIRAHYESGHHAGDRHWTGNLLIEDSPDGATGRAYFTIFKTAKMPREVHQTGTYADTLVKTPAGWRFSSRKITFD
jgi:uncharacterized protein (TIGR02246 family)